MNRFVFIVGMHRSGTSCLAGCLERCGLYLGKVRRTGRSNVKGYYELRAVQLLHDQILGLNQGGWYSPPSDVRVHPYHKQQLEKIANHLSNYRPCGLKDPRLVLLLDTWLELVTSPYGLVGTFRHPLAVAQSLARRNGISEESGLALWLYYNEILIQRHQENPFPIIEFDLSDHDAYCRNVAALADTLDLFPRLSQLRYFVSQDLDHHSISNMVVPEECRQAYMYLQDHRFRFEKPATDTQWRSGHLTGVWSHILGVIQEVAFSTKRIWPALLKKR